MYILGVVASIGLLLLVLWLVISGASSIGWLFLLLILGVFVARFVDRFVWIRVPEMKAAVVFNVERQAFIGFLPAGRHLLFFPLEQVRDFISIDLNAVRGLRSRTLTSDGITITMSWSLTYRFDPFDIPMHIRPTLARLLPQRGDRLLQSQVNHCLNLIVSDLAARTIYQEGGRERLEQRLDEVIRRRLDIFGVEVFRIMLTAIEFPPQVQANLETAHERELFAASEARALVQLQTAVSRFTESDMQRLLQLEQLHVLGQNGVALHLPLTQIINERPVPPTNGKNGIDAPGVVPPGSKGPKRKRPSLH